MMRRLCSLALAGSAVLACAASSDADTADAITPTDEVNAIMSASERDSACAAEGNHWRCSEIIERAALQGDSAYVMRSGDTLRLLLENGVPVVYVNLPLPTVSDRVISERQYFYVGRIGTLKHFVVEGLLNHIVIDARSGRELRVAGLPHPSADGLYFAVGEAEDGSYGDFRGGIRIWSVGNDSLSAVLERDLLSAPVVQGRPWGARNLRWTSKDTLVFDKVFEGGTARVIRSSAGWRIEDVLETTATSESLP